jgi:hypothetical protein
MTVSFRANVQVHAGETVALCTTGRQSLCESRRQRRRLTYRVRCEGRHPGHGRSMPAHDMFMLVEEVCVMTYPGEQEERERAGGVSRSLRRACSGE